MKYLVLLVLLFGCGRPQTKVRTTRFLTENHITAAESVELDSVLDKIQTDFDELKLNVNVRSIPYTVNTLDENKAGTCYKRGGRAIGITLDHSIFGQSDLDGFLRDVHRVVLHEIGHCFFNRSHEDGIYTLEGYSMIAPPMMFSFIMTTVMATGGMHLIPKNLWPYYVKEIAGLDRMNIWTDLKKYVDIYILRKE